MGTALLILLGEEGAVLSMSAPFCAFSNDLFYTRDRSYVNSLIEMASTEVGRI